MKKIRIPISKKKIIIAVVVLLLAGGAAYYFMNKSDGLTDEERRLLDETKEVLKAGEIDQTVSSVTIAEVESSIRDEKYEEAQKQIYEVLGRDNLTPSETASAYTALSQTCLPLEDFECFDKVITHQESQETLDYYLVVDAARLAKKKGDSEKAKEYYQIALDEIDLYGGEGYVDELNQNTMIPLDYEEIQKGAEG